MAEIKITCPHCEQHFRGNEGYCGRKIRCPVCLKSFRVEEVKKTAEPALGDDKPSPVTKPAAEGETWPLFMRPRNWKRWLIVLPLVLVAAFCLVRVNRHEFSPPAAKPIIASVKSPVESESVGTPPTIPVANYSQPENVYSQYQTSPLPAGSQIIDTTTPGLWVTAPFAFLDLMKEKVTLPAKATLGPGWSIPPVSLGELRDGVQSSTVHALNGQSSLEWQNLPKYPTVASRNVPVNWSSFGKIQIQLYSEKATGDVITLGVQSGSSFTTVGLPKGHPATQFFNYWIREITVDWTGWKEFSFPLSEFEKIGSPAGWNTIGGLYFFSKCQSRSPDPATTLFIGRIGLLPKTSQDPATTAAKDDFLFMSGGGWPYGTFARLNHDEPEVSRNLEPGTPLIQHPFFAGARDLYGYHPRYNPGAVSFDPRGQAFLRNDYTIDWLDAKGLWQEVDFSAVIKDYAREQGWRGIGFSSGRQEPKVRFDWEGAVYMLVAITQQIERDKEDWGGRATLLLHAKGIGQPWFVDKLPFDCDFENLDTFNQDALNHPPVITHGNTLILPEKNSDGSLTIPAPVKFSEFAFSGTVHSGGGNFVVSKGDYIYVVYSFVPPLPGPIPWTLVGDEKWKATLPPIPANHPGRSLSFGSKPDPRGRPQIPCRAADGMPTFVISYNRSTQQFSAPVFVGYGGSRMDPHNWPAMTIDSHGNLHVLISGHCEPLTYTHTIIPGDITRWSAPVYIRHAPGEITRWEESLYQKQPHSNLENPFKENYSMCTYPSLNCDRYDNLLCVMRSDSAFYNHRLAVLTKPAGTEIWNEERPLIVPARTGYHVWLHRTSYNPVSNRFYLGYYDAYYNFDPDAGIIEPLFNSFIWPDKKEVITDFTILTSDDCGKTWHLATTPDFAMSAAPAPFPATSFSPRTDSQGEKLKTLKQFLDQGLIPKELYDQQVRKILSVIAPSTPVVSTSSGSSLLSTADERSGRATQPSGSVQMSQPHDRNDYRIFTIGHSFHAWLPGWLKDVALSAGIKNLTVMGVSSIGGSEVIQHWNIPDEKNQAKAALTAGVVDVLTMSPKWRPDEGIEKFAELALSHNPDIRITVQEFWMPNDELHDFGDLGRTLRTWKDPQPDPDPQKEGRNPAHFDIPTGAQLRKLYEPFINRMDEHIRALNKQFGKQVLFIVPVGQAVITLREMVAAGKVPGITKQSELFKDKSGHPKAPICALSAYCHFAVIYHQSPVGLPIPPQLAREYNDPKLNRLLQEVAWETVIHHLLTGITNQ